MQPNPDRQEEPTSWNIRRFTSAEQLQGYLQEWQRLADTSVEANFYYEPWALLPAIDAFSANCPLEFLLVFSNNEGHEQLRGLFPLERIRSYGLRTLRLWKYRHCTLCTPLVHRSCSAEVLGIFFDWLESRDSGCALFDMKFINADGPFNLLLWRVFEQRAPLMFPADVQTRAFLLPRDNDESYLSESLSHKRRKEFGRLSKRLYESAPTRFRSLERSDDIECWLNDFLRLEASGWKGEDGGALANDTQDRVFFGDMLRAAHRLGRVAMLALYSGEQIVAMRCAFLAQHGAFVLKIAFDESYAKFSPGVLLEIENIKRFHQQTDVKWMDSCADSDNAMINRIWLDRRITQSLVLASNKFGRLLVSLLPLFRWINRTFFLRTKK